MDETVKDVLMANGHDDLVNKIEMYDAKMDDVMKTMETVQAPTPVIPTPIETAPPVYPVAMPETGAGRAKYYALGAGIGLGLVGIGVGGYFLTKFLIKKHNEKKASKAAEDIVDSDDFLDEEEVKD